MLHEIYQKCCAQADKPAAKMVNHVRRIYDFFRIEEISAKIAELVRPRDVEWDGKIEIIFQTLENLQAATPGHNGMWYFNGEYPTPGGYAVLNQAYINF